jgi:dolichyl-phosphate beta-glucosyltransferase
MTQSVSIVIPCYNEETRITITLARTLEYLRQRSGRSEIVVVDDGSTDDTARLVESFCGVGAESQPAVRLIRQSTNQGKGAAIRRGMLEATGDFVLFMDADLATPIEELEKLFVYARQGFDVVIASRGLNESDIQHRQSRVREALGRSFNGMVRWLLVPGITDTQCGFKLFTRAAARQIFSEQHLDGYAFDVEVLWLAQRHGFRIKEVPVVWNHMPHSKVSPLRDGVKMIADVWKLRLGGRGGRPR